MAENFNLLRRVHGLTISPEQAGYSGVVIFAGQDEEGNNIEYFAGDRTGSVLEVTNEWGTQAQADALYHKILGYRYQGFKADGTYIDPSSEIGDAVTVNGVYGGVFSKDTAYGRNITTALEAPYKDEVEHEFQVQSPTNRQYERFTRSVRASLSITYSQIAAEVEDRKAEDNLLRATLNIQAKEIEAKVSKEGGNPSSFSWKLLDYMFSVSGKSEEKFRVDEDGAYVNGIIRATGGKIGGFDIMSNYLSFNGQTWGGTNTTGGYFGTSGLQLGKYFQVDMQGHATLESADIRGTLRAGDIIYGGDAGYFSGSGLSNGSVYGGSGGKISGGSISTFNTTGGINTSLGYADYSNGVFNGWNRAPQIACNQISASQILFGGRNFGASTISYMGSDNKAHAINVVTWSWR